MAQIHSFHDLVLARGGVLRTPDGDFQLVKIGKGAFSTIYESKDRLAVVAIVMEGAYDKEMLAAAHEDAPRNPHIPAIKRYGSLTDGRQVFTMPRYATPYRAPNATKASHAAYKLMRKCLDAPINYKARPYEIVEAQIECMARAGVEPKILAAVRTIQDSAANYGDGYRMEISPRNVATDAAGNLVLLDIMFDQDLMNRIREAKRKAAERARRW